MAKELQADVHERYASWLERVAADRLGELEEILGYHFERAALYRRELELPDDSDAGRRAAELLARAGTRAYDRGDVAAAQTLLDRTVSLLSPGDPLRVRTLPLLGAAIHGAAGGMDLALEALAQALEESRIAGDRAAEASAWTLHQLVSITSVPGTDIEAIQRDIQSRAPEIERLNDARTLVWLRRLELEIALYRLADVDVAAERLLAAARAAGNLPNALRPSSSSPRGA